MVASFPFTQTRSVIQRVLLLTVVGMACGLPAARADGPADNSADNVRRVPKLGIEVPAAEAEALKAELATLEKSLAELRQAKPGSVQQQYLPDVEIFHKAVHDTLTYQEFFDPKEVGAATELVKLGQERAAALLMGAAPWTTATGLVVRGYRSKIDNSVQPYGLIVPAVAVPKSVPVRLDVWFHGRGETLSEVNFIHQRLHGIGPINPPDTIVLHPYGRYCNANKFAGEIDTLEAIESVERNYRVDPDRTTVRGFSMGGAACWQFAVHYADRWAAATPGAGFSETPDFLKVFQKETLTPTWYEQKLWHMYDCTDWVVNLQHCPTIAYSGENDSQKQAADVMEAAMKKQKMNLVHLIGPKMGHSYHPDSAAEIERRLASIVAKGRERLPQYVKFTTYTLKYNRMAWVTVDGLAEHWAEGHVEAEFNIDNRVRIVTKGVTDLTLSMPAGWCPFDPSRPVRITVDDQIGQAPAPQSDRSWEVKLHRTADGAWHAGPRPTTGGLHKVHDLQGPIDDAFMDSFIFVRPTGKSPHEKVQAWTTAELDRAIEHWRRQFHGQARVKDDTQITPEDIASSNLVLWGDPTSNQQLKAIVDKLPIEWTAEKIAAGKLSFPAAEHALIAIYPNPLNPKRYVVLNSSFTFRDYDYLNNARQVSKLPDWAVIDLNTPANSRWPGKVVAADFFGEGWELRPPRTMP